MWSWSVFLAAPLSKHTSNKAPSKPSSIYRNKKLHTEDDELNSAPSLRVFSFLELKAATRNFKADRFIGEGGFGRVFKGFIEEKSTNNDATGSIVAIKRLNHEGHQGLKEWLVIMTFTWIMFCFTYFLLIGHRCSFITYFLLIVICIDW